MAIVTRVPLGFPTPSFSSSLSKSSQCHKHRNSLVALSTTSIRVIPETSTLFSPYIILSNSPFLQKRDTQGFRRVKVVSAAMADLAPSTVLVTGAGGRTGLITSLSFSLFFFLVCKWGFGIFVKGFNCLDNHVKNGALCLSGCNNYIKFGGLNGLPLAIRVYVQLHYIVLYYFIPSSHACILNKLTL